MGFGRNFEQASSSRSSSQKQSITLDVNRRDARQEDSGCYPDGPMSSRSLGYIQAGWCCNHTTIPSESVQQRSSSRRQLGFDGFLGSGTTGFELSSPHGGPQRSDGALVPWWPSVCEQPVPMQALSVLFPISGPDWLSGLAVVR